MRPLFLIYGHAVKIVLNHGAKCETGLVNVLNQIQNFLLNICSIFFLAFLNSSYNQVKM